MRFYLTFGFLGFEVVKKRTMNLFKGMKISDFRILSGWIEKYKLALSKSDSPWDNSCYVRLVIVSLAVNIGKFNIGKSNLIKNAYPPFLIVKAIKKCLDY